MYIGWIAFSLIVVMNLLNMWVSTLFDKFYLNALCVSGVQPKEWNSAICTNLKVSLIKVNFTICIDVSETVPNTKYTVNTSGGTIRMAYTSMWGLQWLLLKLSFTKSIRARWGLIFSITEHCFGHQIVNFSMIWLIFCEQAPLEP